jgi:hypothetical protein
MLILFIVVVAALLAIKKNEEALFNDNYVGLEFNTEDLASHTPGKHKFIVQHSPKIVSFSGKNVLNTV